MPPFFFFVFQSVNYRDCIIDRVTILGLTIFSTIILIIVRIISHESFIKTLHYFTDQHNESKPNSRLLYGCPVIGVYGR